MRTIELVLPEAHPAQAQAHAEARRFSVLDAGRRWGKDVWQLERLVEPALHGYPVGWFFPTYKMLGDAWRESKLALQPVTARKWEVEHRIELLGGGVFDMWSLQDPDKARGREYKRIAVNEAGEVAQLQYAWEYVLRATLADLRGDAIFAGTPKGLNYFFELYQRGQDKANEDWVSWQFPTRLNPYIAPQEIEDARQELPERAFMQEWEAEFLEDAGAVFRNVAACLTAPEADPSKHARHRVVLGADWAKELDFTTFSAGCADCKVEIARDRFNQIDYAFQRQRLGEFVKTWKVKGLLPERNAIGVPIIEQLIRDGLPLLPGPDGEPGFQTSATTKPQLIENLALKIERGQWQFQPDETWKLELMAYTQRRNAVTGQPTYSAPPGRHDDTVIARALMVWAAGDYRNLPEKQPEQKSKWRDESWTPLKKY